MPRPWHLDAARERAQYDLHDNDPADAGYRRFLSRAADAVAARVAPPAAGLDFGCGPGPALAAMLTERGYRMATYDPFYAPDPTPLAGVHDFITATEVFEHLRDPRAEIERLLACLRPRGWLVVMTKRPLGERDAFAAWHYIRDPTHIAFFASATFDWIARQHGLRLDIVGADVVALRKG